jgi:hypothetical protein
MESLKEIIPKVMRDLTSKKSPTSGATPDVWLKKVLTKKELKHIKVKYFRKGILGLTVDSSSWLYALSLKKEELLSKLQGIEKAIKDMHFSLGEL